MEIEPRCPLAVLENTMISISIMERSKSHFSPTQIGEQEVHLWLIELNAETNTLQSTELLSSEECRRTSAFRFLKDSLRFATTRSALRLLLGRYLNADPRRLIFDYSRMGKPSLGGEHSTSGLQFNVSHCAEMSMLAFTTNRAIGVDIERVRENLDTDEIAERFFSENEKRTLSSLPVFEKRRGFFDCWTRKEAYLKARGEGLALLETFDVSIELGEPPCIRATRPDPAEAKRWTMLLPPVPRDFAAAVVVEGQSCILKSYPVMNYFDLVSELRR